MQRNSHTTSYASLPFPAPSGAPGFFHRGDPSQGIPATVPTADWANGITEEQLAVIEAAGLTPDIADNTQLLQASLLLAQRTNRVLNAQMANWQAASSLTAGTTGSNYSADQWRVQSAGSTYAVTQGTFSTGQIEVPAAPQKYLILAVSSVTGAANYCRLTQPLEDVNLYSARTVTASFWARATVNGAQINACFEQYFGPTGSAPVPGIGRTKLTLTDTWAEYHVTAEVPSASGKTVNAAQNTYLDLQLWMDAGSDFNAITNTLGQASKTVYVTNATCVIGPTKLAADIKLDWSDFLLLQRYYQKGGVGVSTPSANGVWIAQTVPASTQQFFPSTSLLTRMRSAPTVTIVHPVSGAPEAYNVTRATACSASVVERVANAGFVVSATTPAGSAAGDQIGFHWVADARF